MDIKYVDILRDSSKNLIKSFSKLANTTISPIFYDFSPSLPLPWRKVLTICYLTTNISLLQYPLIISIISMLIGHIIKIFYYISSSLKKQG